MTKRKLSWVTAGYLELYNGDAYIKTIILYGVGYSRLQRANSLRFKYRIISLILYKEWEVTRFSEAFNISVSPYLNNLYCLLQDWHLDEYLKAPDARGITRAQGPLFACLDTARLIANLLTEYERKERRMVQVAHIHRYGYFCANCQRKLENDGIEVWCKRHPTFRALLSAAARGWFKERAN